MLTKNDLNQIRQVVKEEVQTNVGHLRIETTQLRKEINQIRENLTTLDIKIEIIHNKLTERIDNLYEEMKDGFERVLNTIDEERVKRIERLEKHVSLI